jgi:hypothetical protein
LKTPDIIFSIMQKPLKKCVFPMRVSRFLHIRNKHIRRLKKRGRKSLEISHNQRPETGPGDQLFSTFRNLLNQHGINLTGFFFTHGLRILSSID